MEQKKSKLQGKYKKRKLYKSLLVRIVLFLFVFLYTFSSWSYVSDNPSFLPKIEKAHAATFSMQTGIYTGDGTDNRQITGIGFQPNLVMIKDDTTAGSYGIVWKSSSMSGETSALFGEGEADLTNNYIQSLDANGFTIGTAADVNTTGVLYYWIAFGGSDCTSSGTFCVGTYSGNGTSQNITTGFQPDMVAVKRSGASLGVWRSSSMGSNDTSYLSATAQDTSGQMIQSLNASTFTIGNNATVNTSGNTYWFFAFKQVSEAMDVGTYAGNATDNRNINASNDAGLTFQPNFVWTKNATAATPVSAVLSISENYGDRSFMATSLSSAPNNIQQLVSSGGFQVGTSSNANGSADTMYYAAFGGASSHTASGTYTMKNGSYNGTGSSFSVSGLGFKPDLVLIKHNDQATDQYAVFRTKDMKGDSTAYLATNVGNFTLAITSLDADGFTIGTNATVNTSGDIYYWTAFGNAWDYEDHTGASDFVVGKYIGDGTDNRNIDRLPFAPDLITVKSNNALTGVWRTSQMSGDITLYFTSATQVADLIQSLNSNGFQLGTRAAVNTIGNSYFYFAFKTGTNTFTVNNYIGNGTSQNITSVGFSPDLIWTKKTTGGTAQGGILRTSAQTGNAAQPFLNTATFTDGFTELLTNGFSVGSSVTTNESTYEYQYAAWKQPTITLSSNGNQTSNVYVNSTNNYMGAFTVVRNTGSTNITQIIVSDTGTVNANSYLSNLDIYYETTANCSYEGTETLFGTASSFNASEQATVAGTITGGTSQICLYLVLDVASAASAGETIDIEITTPASQVNVSSGVVRPTTTVGIDGSTTLQSSGTLSIDIVDSAGNSVSNPSISMAGKPFSYSYQTASGTFSLSAQKIRVTNTTTNPSWTLTIAANTGSTSLWNGGTVYYDFNDPASNAEDGPDADTVGGRMTIDPSASGISSQTGCTAIGLTKGSSIAFSEESQNSITLLSAGTSAGTNCYWDFKNISIYQTIPAEQPAGNYSISMTLTITAT